MDEKQGSNTYTKPKMNLLGEDGNIYVIVIASDKM